MKISEILARTHAVEQRDVQHAFNLAYEHIDIRTSLNEHLRQYDKTDTAVCALESISVLLKEYKPQSTAAMEVITTSVAISLESSGIYIGDRIKNKTPEQRFAIATEGLGEWISRIWKAIAKFMSKIWDFIKSFFTSSSKSEAAVERIEKVTGVVDGFKRDEDKIIAAVKNTADNLQASKQLKEAVNDCMTARGVKISSIKSTDNEPVDRKHTSEQPVIKQFTDAVTTMRNSLSHSDDAGIQGLSVFGKQARSAKEVIHDIERSEKIIEELFRTSSWVRRSLGRKLVKYNDADELLSFINAVSPPHDELEKYFDCKLKRGVFNPGIVEGLDFSFYIDPIASAIVSRIESNHPVSFKPVFYMTSAFYAGDSNRNQAVKIPLLKEKSEFEAILALAKAFRKRSDYIKEQFDDTTAFVKKLEQYAIEKSSSTSVDMKEAAISKFTADAMVFYCVSVPTKIFAAIEKFCTYLERYVEISAHNADPLVAAKSI